MRADHIEISWDAARKKWLLRIRIGEEVIRRYSDAPKDTDDGALKAVGRKTLEDEGYDSEVQDITIRR
jgi:hypothetical protein